MTVKKCFFKYPISTTLLFLASASSTIITVIVPKNSTPTNYPMLFSFLIQQVKEIHKIIHNYLVNNLEVLMKAFRDLKKQLQAQLEQYTQRTIKQHTQKFNDSVSPITGNSNVILTEFFDYQYGHCKAMNQLTQNHTKNKDFRVVFKALPIFGEQSRLAAKASLSAAIQGKCYVFHNALLSIGNSLMNDSVSKTVDQLRKDMNDLTIQKKLHGNFQLAQSLQLVAHRRSSLVARRHRLVFDLYQAQPLNKIHKVQLVR